MTHDPVLQRAVEALEGLASTQPNWGDILGSALDLVGGDSATFMVFDHQGAISMQQLGLPDAIQSDYVEHFRALDIGLEQAMRSTTATWLNTEDMLVSREIANSPYYVDFMCKHRMHQQLCFILPHSQVPQQRIGLSIQRASADPMARHHLAGTRIHMYTNHLQQALRHRQDLSADRLSAIDSAFTSFGEAICLCTPDGELLHHSDAAQQLLIEEGPLRIRLGRLWHPQDGIRSALSGALHAAAQGTAARRLVIPGRADAAACTLELTRAQPHLIFGRETLVLLRIHGARSRSGLSLDALCAGFGITAAEARVLMALADGQPPKEHAHRHGVSIHTVRKQIAMLKDKMDCRRQVDLVRKALAVQ